MTTTEILALLLFPALMAYSAVSDLLRMTISNRVTLAVVLAFAILAVSTGMPLEDVGWHVSAGLVVLVISFACFAFGWIGGGDAKLAAATALWFGLHETVNYLIIGSALGGLLTLALLKMRTYPLPEWAEKHAWIVRLHHEKTGVPYGIALAAAALIVYPDTPWMLQLGV